MTAQRLDGRALAKKIESELTPKVAALTSRIGRPPRLVVVLVGNVAASASYVKSKASAAKRVGITADVFSVPESTTTAELVSTIEAIGQDEHGLVDGILVQLPLPDHVDARAVLDAVPPDRDVDGFHPVNAGLLSQGRPHFIPCTAAGVQRMLLDAGVETRGKHVVIVGRSDIVGKPLALLLASRGPGGDATVSICHSHTSNLKEVTQQADILIAAVGIPQLITADMVKPGAVVVDVGINRVQNGETSRLVGDVDYEPVASVAEAISPVPGGVGPLTVAMLLENTFFAAHERQNI
ncbi:MAG: bifunctional 5,10-methylenetetrahydrofolate dehydrogenase/5,10-methenyltetrahydrofolate cyclohydrolase [Pirellulales bacterium]|nr:bifunctional 5,10-methylene-tetrahydrofolate dehydrogenase/5,10-methylene-tetrahydrofolate cyclohydrolase [Planctomycetaceae bacterium]MCK4616179.1 bifunctional 5,10-methylenetetrahydrofolate dehydrogenase/5,10-methenyltetrahydrofolate cyclohydrolase [Pirellulales bacterium]MDA7975629.1 bifunctional 5,10-methylenetetrahydrofolate dehydrogenase/5,10-methenyltetrahydrofolate cyclohydrolase [Pirellulales bacterium]|tara:strand:+ start:154 stop:1038 length:885 start_codon:yes stop_codon:yes gene_type:complete